MEIKFYKNTKDDLHCFQAALRMVLKYWLPSQSFNYKKLDKISGHLPNKWTWDTRTLEWLAKAGFQVIKISNFDYKSFALRGKKYLKDFWRKDIYETQEEMSDLDREHSIIKKVVYGKNIKFINKTAGLKEIDFYFKNNYTIIASINARVLDNKSGYTNHSVVIVKVNKHHIFFHDPGIPPHENRKISRKKFKQSLGEIIAIKSASSISETNPEQ